MAQSSELRAQGTELRAQSSEIRAQRSEIRDRAQGSLFEDGSFLIPPLKGVRGMLKLKA
jgi:hypothetical protein